MSNATIVGLKGHVFGCKCKRGCFFLFFFTNPCTHTHHLVLRYMFCTLNLLICSTLYKLPSILATFVSMLNSTTYLM